MRGGNLWSQEYSSRRARKELESFLEEVTELGLEGGIGVCKMKTEGGGKLIRESSTSKGGEAREFSAIWILVKSWIRQTAHIVSKKAAASEALQQMLALRSSQ